MLPDDKELMAQLDATGRCASCDRPVTGFYCHTYLGSSYGKGTRILFVGLDHGNDYRTADANDRRRGIVHWYQEKRHGWNPHYRGCIAVAVGILELKCSVDCRHRCCLKPDEDCALCQFAQANAVRCTGADGGMTFSRHDRIRDCLPLVFREIEVLRPRVIILQGRNRGSGHIHRDFQAEARKRGRWEETSNEYVGNIIWNGTGQAALVVSLRHPARAWLERNWETEIIPAMQTVRQLLNQARSE